MRRLEEIMEFNHSFVDEKKYIEYQTSKYPDKKIAILTCMDTRLIELLPKSMGLKNGDVKIIKNAGAIVSHPFGSVMKSILIAVYEQGVEEVIVVGHHDCGASQVDGKEIIKHMQERGISHEVINTLVNSGINLEKWLNGFESVEESIQITVNIIKKHPLFPQDVFVHGLIMDPNTGKLDIIINGYKPSK